MRLRNPTRSPFPPPVKTAARPRHRKCERLRPRSHSHLSEPRARYSVQVKISARHGHLDDAIQQQLTEKGEKLLHFFNRLTMIEITVDLHKERNGKLKVEIVATAEHDREFVGRDEDEDVTAAFTRA